ncbi:MAG TPA: DUF6728 family protein [Chryseosolibacter sp.]
MTQEENMIHGDQAQQPKRNSIKQFFKMGEVGGYFFRKKDPSRPSNINLKMMHGINKISIVIFLLGVIYIVLKRLL